MTTSLMTTQEAQAAGLSKFTEDAVRALKAAQKSTGGIGQAAWIFPSGKMASQPCSRHAVHQWLERTVKYAGLTVPKTFGWHAFRRKFATDMKDLPREDLMAAADGRAPRR